MSNNYPNGHLLVRRHLAKGRHYGDWQIRTAGEDTAPLYYPPNLRLVLTNCQLWNHPKTAARIHGGANKTVCAWIRCETAAIIVADVTPDQSVGGVDIGYNPRFSPHWCSGSETNLDRWRADRIVLDGVELTAFGLNPGEEGSQSADWAERLNWVDTHD